MKMTNCISNIIRNEEIKNQKINQEKKELEKSLRKKPTFPTRESIEREYIIKDITKIEHLEKEIVNNNEKILEIKKKLETNLIYKIRLFFSSREKEDKKSLESSLETRNSKNRQLNREKEDLENIISSTVSNILMGDLSDEVDRKLSDKQYEYEIECSEINDTKSLIKKLEEESERISNIVDYLENRKMHICPDSPLVQESEEDILNLINNIEIKKIEIKSPIIKTIPKSDYIIEFKCIANEIIDQLKSSNYGIYKDTSCFDKLINCCISEIGIQDKIDSSLSAEEKISNLHTFISNPNNINPVLVEILYWVSAKIENDTFNYLPQDSDEEEITSAFCHNIPRILEDVGRKLFKFSGYADDIPLNISEFLIPKKIESSVGADWAVIIQFKLEGKQEYISAALMQSKLYSERVDNNKRWNIYRSKKEQDGYIINEQLKNLTNKAVPGFYIFFEDTKEKGRPTVVISASEAREFLERKNPNISLLKEAQCYVDGVDSIIDFPTFFSKLIDFKNSSFKNISDVIKAIASDNQERLAKRVIVIQIGAELDPELRLQMKNSGYTLKENLIPRAKDRGFEL